MGTIRDDMLFSLPTLNRYEGLAELLDSVEAGTVLPKFYFIVDNGGSLQKSLQALSYRTWFERTHVYVPGENLGVAPSWNLALELGYPYTVIAGDDCRMEANTIEALVKAAQQRPEFGLYSPVVAEGKRHSEWSCFLQTKALTDRIGLYDEVFFPGYFEDDDYRRRMSLAGTVPAKVLESVVHHIGGATSEQFSWSVRFEENQKRYAAKWGGIPGQETVSVPPAPIRRELGIRSHRDA